MKTSILIGVALMIMYGAFLQFGPKPLKLKLQSQWQENRHVAEKYIHQTNAASIVYVGSSLTKRLDLEAYAPCVYNLALDGDSTLTGLGTVAAAKSMPKTIFVESNIPQRGINQNLIDHATGPLLRLSPIFYTENIPTNVVYGLLTGLREQKPFNREPDESLLHSELSRHRQAYEIPLNSEILEKSMAEYRKLTDFLERTGSRIVFFEMPVHPSLESSSRPVQIRMAFRRAFPGNQFMGYEELSLGVNIKTVDGLHLNPDEAKGVIANFRNRLPHACAIDSSDSRSRT